MPINIEEFKSKSEKELKVTRKMNKIGKTQRLVLEQFDGRNAYTSKELEQKTGIKFVSSVLAKLVEKERLVKKGSYFALK